MEPILCYIAKFTETEQKAFTIALGLPTAGSHADLTQLIASWEAAG